jgi:hypothetical protein
VISRISSNRRPSRRALVENFLVKDLVLQVVPERRGEALGFGLFGGERGLHLFLQLIHLA